LRDYDWGSNMKLFLVFTFLLVSVYGCATSKNALPKNAVLLNTKEITDTFSGVKETYQGIDNPAVTSIATWRKNGDFEASWVSGRRKGDVIGNWYAENGKRCISCSNPYDGGPGLECHAIYKTGDVYTSVNDDGTVHGIHPLTPLH